MSSRARTAAAAAGGGLFLLAVIWLAAFHVPRLERLDASILRGFVDLSQHPHERGWANRIAGLCDPDPWVLLAAVPVAVAMLRRRLRLAAGVLALLLGSNVTTQLLKPLLASPRPHHLIAGLPPISAASWPSGHATAAMSLALALVLAMPARLRPWTAVAGAAFAVAVSYSFLSLEWHYPSDVLGGFVVAAEWALLVVAGLLTGQRERSAESGPAVRRVTLARMLSAPAGALVAAVALAAVVAVARPAEADRYLSGHEAFVAGAGVIALLALGLATAVSLVVRRP